MSSWPWSRGQNWHYWFVTDCLPVYNSHKGVLSESARNDAFSDFSWEIGKQVFFGEEVVASRGTFIFHFIYFCTT